MHIPVPLTKSLIGAGLLVAAGWLQCADLITESEAGLPSVQRGEPVTRAITRGPGINLLSPPAGSPTVRSPFDLRLEFVQRGDARVDPETVRVLYDKNPPVNLIERVRAGVSEKGIVLAGAQVPAGRHTLIVSVADIEGRSTTRAFELIVAK